MTPPRPRIDLMRSPRSVPTKSESVTHTLRTPPDISLPITTPPWPRSPCRRRTTMFSLGLPTRQPSSFRPDLITTQSSPVLKKESSIRTFRLESGLQPSLFGPLVSTLTLRTITFSE
jgi:hypothetical protein